MSSKNKQHKTSPAGAFNVEKNEREKQSKIEIDRILNAPRYKQVPIRVLKNTDGKSRKRKSKSKRTKRKSKRTKRTKRKSTKRKSTKRKSKQ